MDKLIRYFTPVFLALLFLDIYVKTNLPIIPYRYYSKIFVLVTLIIFTGYCVYKKNKLNNRYVFYGLIIFFIGDILIIDHLNKVKFIISLILFVVGKLIYILKFTHKEDFSNKRLLPFLVVCFLFVAFLYNLIFVNLKGYFIPVTLYFFISLVMTLFAYLRKDVASNKSYYTVLFGVVLFVFSEATVVIKTFYGDILFQDFIVMFGYGFGQYLIILGLMIDKPNYVENSELISKI